MKSSLILARWTILFMAVFFPAGVVRGGEAPEKEAGIAARYAGDAGIESDSDVLFVEQFEEGSIPAVAKHWTEAKGVKGGVLALSDDVPPGSPGRKSLQMTATKGKDTGGHLWKLFDHGVDEMYARFYVKFSKDHPYVHHFVKIGAWKDSPNWPQGEAGYRHDGARSFQTGIEPAAGYGRFTPPGAWHFYTYWCEMRSWQGPAGTSCYGNSFAPATPEQIPRGQWQCVEFMVKANTAPDKRDGEQAFWIDGRLVGRWAPGAPTGKWVKDQFIMGDGAPFEGFRWRTDNAVKLNTFWLLYYMDSVFKGDSQFKPKQPGVAYNADQGVVWFDHVVVAKKHIGPFRATETVKTESSLFDGKSLKGWKVTEFGDEGKVSVEDGRIVLNQGKGDLTGITYTGSVPRMDYEVSLEAMRVEGSDFFCGLTFPVNKSCCSLIVGGWGGDLVGISSFNDEDASENETTTNMSFENGRWYQIRVRVTEGKIEAWIDKEKLVDAEPGDREISVRAEVEPSQPFGIAAWNTKAALRDIRVRRLGGAGDKETP